MMRIAFTLTVPAVAQIHLQRNLAKRHAITSAKPIIISFIDIDKDYYEKVLVPEW